ncbi:hypothetical protein [Desulfobacter sp.]|uniref:hypothetical protein n=1 Tax=Desulfobacter sp. TaxID=2294 RepID=UPI003D0CD160
MELGCHGVAAIMEPIAARKQTAVSAGSRAILEIGFPTGFRRRINPICMNSSTPKRLINITEPIRNTMSAVNTIEDINISMSRSHVRVIADSVRRCAGLSHQICFKPKPVGHTGEGV